MREENATATGGKSSGVFDFLHSTHSPLSVYYHLSTKYTSFIIISSVVIASSASVLARRRFSPQRPSRIPHSLALTDETETTDRVSIRPRSATETRESVSMKHSRRAMTLAHEGALRST